MRYAILNPIERSCRSVERAVRDNLISRPQTLINGEVIWAWNASLKGEHND